MSSRAKQLGNRVRQARLIPELLAAAITRDGKVLPTWPEKGTGRTSPLAVCGHCNGKPLIIRVCGKEVSRGQTRIRYCAVCEKCGAHRAIQASPGGVAI